MRVQEYHYCCTEVSAVLAAGAVMNGFSRVRAVLFDTATHEVSGTIPVGAEGPLTMEFPLVDGVVDPATGTLYVECLLANTPAVQILQAG